MTPADLNRITAPATSAFLPELRWRALPRGETLDRFRTRHSTLLGAGVPYWAVAWPGGQGMARFLLDHPEVVAARPVVDLGCGNGLVAAAAMKAGAVCALAVDIDPNALTAAAETARLNGVTVETARIELAHLPPQEDAVICAADLWYEPLTARQATAALTRLAPSAARVLAADPGRPDRPRRGTTELARYRIPASPDFERADIVETRVLNFTIPDMLAGHPPHAPDGRGIGEGFGVKLPPGPKGPASGRET